MLRRIFGKLRDYAKLYRLKKKVEKLSAAAERPELVEFARFYGKVLHALHDIKSYHRDLEFKLQVLPHLAEFYANMMSTGSSLFY